MVWDSIYASLNMSLFIIIFLCQTCVCLLLVCLMLQVHHRFYSAYDNTTLLYEILKSIKWARKTYVNLLVNVVVHSIGGDLASFCALGLFISIFNVLDLLYQISIYALQITCTCFVIPSHVLLIYQLVGFIDISTFFTC
jgi:hypothetical protein